MRTKDRIEPRRPFLAISNVGVIGDYDTAEAAREAADKAAAHTGAIAIVATVAANSRAPRSQAEAARFNRIVYRSIPSKSAVEAAEHRKRKAKLRKIKEAAEALQMKFDFDPHCDPTAPAPVYTGPRRHE